MKVNRWYWLVDGDDDAKGWWTIRIGNEWRLTVSGVNGDSGSRRSRAWYAGFLRGDSNEQAVYCPASFKTVSEAKRRAISMAKDEIENIANELVRAEP